MTRSFRSWWDLFLFRDRGIVPTRRLLYIAAVLLVLVTGLAALGVSPPYLLSLNAVVFLLSLLDLTLMPAKKQIHLRRSMDEEIERGLKNEAAFSVENNSDRPMFIEVIDHFPSSFSKPFPLKGWINDRGGSDLVFSFTAGQRGDYRIPSISYRWRSSIGLWARQGRSDQEMKVRVIPDLSGSRDFLKDAQRFLLYEGTRIRKDRVGSGEFSQIRSYVTGDDIRKINWRQTAKQQELMMNEYEPEHGKYVTILIDCGRMMGVELEDHNRLEKALEAALTVTTAALKRGDYVSLAAFSKHVHVYVPPGKGMAHMQTILKEVYHLEVEGYESNYASVFQYLQSVQNKRSLFLLFSDVTTFLYEETALHYLMRLRRSHLFLMVGIRDRAVDEAASRSPEDVTSTMVKSMAQKQLMDKKEEMRRWESRGLPMVEAPEEALASASVSYYIDIMNRGLL